MTSKIIMCVFVTVLFLTPVPAQQQPPTVAEASQYSATSTHAEVMEFIKELQRLSPLLRVETLCRSAEGRDVPLLIIGNPPPASPSDLKYTGRSAIYIQANIHAGEVEGKEATLMLARDILLQKHPPLLDNVVLLITPIFNADGNDKISPNNRNYQPGPQRGVGVRASGQNLDLNRDAMKLESIEVRAMVNNVLNRWDPLLVVDCHTTDGAYHEQTVTYSWPLNPNGDPALMEFQRSTMLPAIGKLMNKNYKTLSLPYGTYRDPRQPEKGWETFEPQPRFVTNYVGLRDRFSILDENYVHADYKTRVQSCYNFLLSILEYCHDHVQELAKIVAEADRNTIQRGLAPTPADTFALEFDLRPLPDPVTVLGFEMEFTQREGSPYPEGKVTDRKKKYTIPYFADYIPKRSVQIPFAYVLPPTSSEAVSKLLEHGILVERLTQPDSLDVEVFTVKELTAAERLYQGHRINQIKGAYTKARIGFPVGAYIVLTAQPLGRLVSYLLEPESDDGLMAWNYFDRDIASQWSREFQTYPVARLLRPANLVKTVVR